MNRHDKAGVFYRVCQRAATAHATANRTDPFAYNRMLTHLLNGIEDPAQVISEAGRFGAVA